jgi:hypothetical protein
VDVGHVTHTFRLLILHPLPDCSSPHSLTLAENGIHTAYRIAGHDKVQDIPCSDRRMCGSDSYDIDIALENLTGPAFTRPRVLGLDLGFGGTMCMPMNNRTPTKKL